jgi:hypothetical protein
MNWKDIDFFEMESSAFSQEVHAVIVPLFDQGRKAIEVIGE